MRITSLLSLGLLALSMNVQAAKVEFTTPAPGDLEIGQTFVLNLDASEFQSDLQIVAGGFRLSFDTSILELTSFTPNALWNGPGGLSSGDYFFTTFNFPLAPRGAFNIGTLTFRTIGYGFTDINLSAPSIENPWGVISSTGEYPNAAAIQYGSLSVLAPDPTAPVPVPAAAWLFGTGLLAFGRSFKRRLA